MIVLTKKLTIQEVAELGYFPDNFVKGVVDIEQGIVALDAEWHIDLANFLKETRGSQEINMWGFNLWLKKNGIDAILVYDSLINIHNNQLHGFLRGGLEILDPDIKSKATEVICKWIEF